MSASNILKDAKQYIIDHGWCDAGPSRYTGEVCAIIAINRVLGCYSNCISLMAPCEFLRSTTLDRHKSISVYNDHVCGKENDDNVYAWFDRAIALAERMEGYGGVDHGSPDPDETCNHIDPPEEDCPFCGVKAPEYALA